MELFSLLEILSRATFVVIIFECLYSIYRKDNIHSRTGTTGNFLNGVVLKLVTYVSYPVCFGFAMTTFSLLGYQSEYTFNIISLIVALIVVDFIYYIFHRLHHTFRLFWAFHYVHHGDNHLNLSTAYRVSWIEQIYIMFFFLTPTVLTGIHPVDVFLSFMFLSFYQFFCHSQYIKLPRFFDYLFVTPHNHGIHHDQKSKNQNSNFGGVFSIWDRILKTYVAEIPTFIPGIQGYQQDNPIQMQVDPIVSFLKQK